MLVLLVEDNVMIELLAEDYLRSAGHEVLTATTGQEAITLFRDARPRPDALVLDNRLPDMLGWDVAEACRTLASQVPIVMCSGDAWTGARYMAAAVKVEKPYTGEQLLDALAKAGQLIG